jgi:hypothetical protein
MVVSGIKGQPKVILHQAGKRVYNQVLEGISTGWCFGLNPVLSGSDSLTDILVTFTR